MNDIKWKIKQEYSSKQVMDKNVSLPSYGECKQITDYDAAESLTVELKTSSKSKSESYSFFITDREQSTWAGLAYSTQLGDPIIVSRRFRTRFKVVEAKSYNLMLAFW